MLTLHEPVTDRGATADSRSATYPTAATVVVSGRAVQHWGIPIREERMGMATNPPMIVGSQVLAVRNAEARATQCHRNPRRKSGC